jgi:ParB-like chromosome segregation protein Spo0J
MQHAQRMVALDHIRPHPRNTRTHSKKQIRQIADSIRAVGFTSPVLIDENGVLLAGHGRLEAAKLLGLKMIPAVVIAGLSEARKRALVRRQIICERLRRELQDG